MTGPGNRLVSNYPQRLPSHWLQLARDRLWVTTCVLKLWLMPTDGSSFDYVPPPNAAWVPFQKRRVISLPDRLFEEYNGEPNTVDHFKAVQYN